VHGELDFDDTVIEYLKNATELTIERGYDSEYYYIGVFPRPTRDGNNREQMKNTHEKIMRIHDIVNDCEFFTDAAKKKILGNLEWHSEAWRD